MVVGEIFYGDAKYFDGRNTHPDWGEIYHIYAHSQFHAHDHDYATM